MAYKLNRIGTPSFFENKTIITTAPPAGYVGWESTLSASNRVIVFPDPTLYTQFGVVRGYVNAVDTLAANRSLCFGQVFQVPEVVNGNSVAVECCASIYGLMPENVGFIHGYGRLTTAPTTAWDTEVSVQPAIAQVQQAENAQTGLAYRAFKTKSVIVFHEDQPAIQTELYEHHIELFPQAGGAAAGTGNYKIQLAFRSILNGRELENYDPVR